MRRAIYLAAVKNLDAYVSCEGLDVLDLTDVVFPSSRGKRIGESENRQRKALSQSKNNGSISFFLDQGHIEENRPWVRFFRGLWLARWKQEFTRRSFLLCDNAPQQPRMSEPTTRGPEKHISFLDPIRGLAILGVFLYHSMGATFGAFQLGWNGPPEGLRRFPLLSRPGPGNLWLARRGDLLCCQRLLHPHQP